MFSNNIAYYIFSVEIREDIRRKKTFSFGHCPNYLPTPPWLQFGQLGPLFSDVKIQNLKNISKKEYLDVGRRERNVNNLKTIQRPKHLYFGKYRLLFFLVKNALLQKGPNKKFVHGYTHTLWKVFVSVGIWLNLF